MENFKVEYKSDRIDDNTSLVTMIKTEEDLSARDLQILASALEKYNMDKSDVYSVITNENSVATPLTLKTIDNLSIGINSDMSKVITANEIILQNVIEDGLMGYAYNCLSSNIPNSYQIKYAENINGESDAETLDNIKFLIESFNRDVHLERLINDIAGKTYLEGNCPMVLRLAKNSGVIDILPIDIAYPSGYRLNNDDIIEVDVDLLKKRLSKSYKKTKKNKALYFDKLDSEIKNNFSPEVYTAYKNGEKYARIDTDSADCVKINSMGRQFGVSPLFRALRPLVVLNNIENADVSDSKARSKKIILQLLRKELLGEDGKRKGFAEQANAHESLMAALKTNICAYTAAPFVESVQFVTAKSNDEEASRTMSRYTTKFLQSLGISFVDTEIGTYATANISITQLLRTINQILTDIERVINKFYKTLIRYNGLPEIYAPTIKIDKAETLDLKLRKELATFMYSTLGASRQTVFKMVDLDLKDEEEKRKEENTRDLDEVFAAYPTAYTKSAEDSGVSTNPSGDENEERKQLDNDYTKQVRE